MELSGFPRLVTRIWCPEQSLAISVIAVAARQAVPAGDGARKGYAQILETGRRVRLSVRFRLDDLSESSP
jgi:hypothetical protein